MIKKIPGRGRMAPIQPATTTLIHGTGSPCIGGAWGSNTTGTLRQGLVYHGVSRTRRLQGVVACGYSPFPLILPETNSQPVCATYTQISCWPWIMFRCADVVAFSTLALRRFPLEGGPPGVGGRTSVGFVLANQGPQARNSESATARKPAMPRSTRSHRRRSVYSLL